MATSSLTNLSRLRDDARCFAFVRQQRRPDGVRCPGGASDAVIRDGCDDTRPCRRCYPCKACGGRCDDLTGTVLAGRHQPLRMWVLSLYLMGLDASDTQSMTEQLRHGLVAKTPVGELQGEVEIDEVYVMAGHKGQPAAMAKGGGASTVAG
jgi:hypothetical protein